MTETSELQSLKHELGNELTYAKLIDNRLLHPSNAVDPISTMLGKYAEVNL